jgi:HEPN domain-containing protein
MKPAIRQWIEQSRYDLDTAKAMMAQSRWLYVLFCAQQALEKALKAVITMKTEEFPPRIHNLLRLAEVADLSLNESQSLFLGELSAYYIQTRYPDEIDLLANMATFELAAETLKNTEEVAEWLFSIVQ